MQIPTSYALHDVVSYFERAGLGAEPYVHFHKYRYRYLLDIIQCLSRGRADLQVMDVGPYYQTNLIRSVFPKHRVHTLGFNTPINHLSSEEQHIDIDLNHTETLAQIGSVKVDIILMAEVIEHLYTKPEVVLDFLKHFLKDDGAIIIQTPNAVALPRRARMLVGQNPFQLIHANRQGHFREYTTKELESICTNIGLEVKHLSLANYFNPDQTMVQRLYQKSELVIPKQLRDGITIVAQKV